MMDIVERLRNPLIVTDARLEVCAEAANEIERLRDRNERWCVAAKKFMADESGAELHAMVVEEDSKKA